MHTRYQNKHYSRAHKILKDEVEHKYDLPDFINKMRRLLEKQRHKVKCALLSTAEYRLGDEYRYLQVESS